MTIEISLTKAYMRGGPCHGQRHYVHPNQNELTIVDGEWMNLPHHTLVDHMVYQRLAGAKALFVYAGTELRAHPYAEINHGV